MSKSNLQLGAALLALSAFFYFIHFLIFRDAHHIFIYLVGDIAFVPIEVLLVTLIIHRYLNLREKRTLLRKMNMLIGAFFSEVGTGLLRSISGFAGRSGEINEDFKTIEQWTDKEFFSASKEIKVRDCEIEVSKGSLEELRDLLREKRGFFLRLLENPNLLEHDSFTELLWAVFHLTEELILRPDLKQLPHADRAHLSVDIERAYVLLVAEWVIYMRHLKKEYPFLFSLAVRTNPFDPCVSVEIQS